MTLYHGSTVSVEEPRILESDVGRDFGFAFYTTDIKAQAERWAVRRAKYAQKGGQTKAVAVVSYVVAGVMPKEMALEKLRFQQISNQIAFCTPASLKFLRLVRSYELEVAQ